MSATRWTPRRKAQLIRDVASGLVSPQAAQDQHAMSVEELELMVRRYGKFGEEGLKAGNEKIGRV